jgi:hypothetical protein
VRTGKKATEGVFPFALSPSKAILVHSVQLRLPNWYPMDFLTAPEAKQFADTWLPAWTGNDPERLASFYAEDALYVDPGVPLGVRGRLALVEYFRKLLGYNPNWVWTQLEAIPMEAGFLNKWSAVIPVGNGTLQITGVCLVQLNAQGQIRRNEVYFDRSVWLQEIARQRTPS